MPVAAAATIAAAAARMRTAGRGALPRALLAVVEPILVPAGLRAPGTQSKHTGSYKTPTRSMLI